jgi:hypothetical protein
MTVIWHDHGGYVTEDHEEIVSVGISTPEPILALSEPWEVQKENREISALLAGVFIVAVVIVAWLIVWWHPW